MNGFLVKERVTEHEAEMQRRAVSLLPANVPGVVLYEKEHERMTMHFVHGETLADFYGAAVPDWVWAEVRRLVMALYVEGIVYADITGYNFMIETDSDNIWMLDFEHCTTRDPGPFVEGEPTAMGESWFVREFLSGNSGNKWNEDFA